MRELVTHIQDSQIKEEKNEHFWKSFAVF